MTSSVLAALPDLLGEQRPRLLSVPPRVSTVLGRDAVRLARKAGLSLNPWQEFLLEESLAQDPEGLYTASDVGVVVSRQNGKGEVIVARQLAGLFMLDEPLQVYTSHLFTTTMEMHRRLKTAVYAYAPFAKRVLNANKGGNDVGVELRSGQRVRFLARSASSGRGFSVDATLYLDEAMNLTDPELDALMPTTTTARNAQVWYVGSAGIGEPSQVFARVRRRALGGDAGRLLWAEWSIPDDVDLDDESYWGMGNPGLGYGQVTMRTLHGYRDNMSREGFAREYLGRGDWPDPGMVGAVISSEDWAACLDEGSRFGSGPTALGVQITGDRATAYVAGVGRRADGLLHAQLVAECYPSRAVVEIAALSKKRAAPVVIDPGSHAGSLIQDLEAAGVEVVQVTLQKLSAAAGSIFDAIKNHELRHIGQKDLTVAATSASTRVVSRDAWMWKGPATTPLVAVTLALHGYGAEAESAYESRGLVTL